MQFLLMDTKKLRIFFLKYLLIGFVYFLITRFEPNLKINLVLDIVLLFAFPFSIVTIKYVCIKVFKKNPKLFRLRSFLFYYTGYFRVRGGYAKGRRLSFRWIWLIIYVFSMFVFFLFVYALLPLGVVGILVFVKNNGFKTLISQ